MLDFDWFSRNHAPPFGASLGMLHSPGGIKTERSCRLVGSKLKGSFQCQQVDIHVDREVWNMVVYINVDILNRWLFGTKKWDDACPSLRVASRTSKHFVFLPFQMVNPEWCFPFNADTGSAHSNNSSGPPKSSCFREPVKEAPGVTAPATSMLGESRNPQRFGWKSGRFFQDEMVNCFFLRTLILSKHHFFFTCVEGWTYLNSRNCM